MLIASHICWNLFLALIPAALGILIGWLSWHDRDFIKKWQLWLPLLLVWVGFLPNTIYLLTEWRHFIEFITLNPHRVLGASHDPDELLYFLGLSPFYVVYSGIGLLTFSMALWPVARWLRPSRLTRLVFFLICALGVYLGLIKRLNTWDVVNKPDIVMASIADALSNPFTIAMIISFALVIWLSYWTFEVFMDGLLVRIRIRRGE